MNSLVTSVVPSRGRAGLVEEPSLPLKEGRSFSMRLENFLSKSSLLSFVLSRLAKSVRSAPTRPGLSKHAC